MGDCHGLDCLNQGFARGLIRTGRTFHGFLCDKGSRDAEGEDTFGVKDQFFLPSFCGLLDFDSVRTADLVYQLLGRCK